jgi:hypothetical protein
VTTRELVTYIQRKASGYTRPEILSILDQVQKVVMSKVTAQRTVIDETTGMPPYLATTDGVFTYNCPANCLRTAVVFAEDLPGYTRIQYGNTIATYRYDGTDYYTLNVKSTDAQYGVLAKLTFVGINPGTTTNKYYHLYSFKAPDITAETVNLSIPENHHLEIVDGVLARIRSEKFGDNSEWQFWIMRTMPTMVSELNSGAQPYLGATKTQPEYRNYPGSYLGYR